MERRNCPQVFVGSVTISGSKSNLVSEAMLQENVKSVRVYEFKNQTCNKIMHLENSYILFICQLLLYFKLQEI